MSNTKLKCAIIHAESSVIKLANGTGLHEQTIRRAINNHNVTVSNAIRISKFLGVKVEDIFGEQLNKKDGE